MQLLVTGPTAALTPGGIAYGRCYAVPASASYLLRQQPGRRVDVRERTRKVGFPWQGSMVVLVTDTPVETTPGVWVDEYC